jgi:hypothetical protein
MNFQSLQQFQEKNKRKPKLKPLTAGPPSLAFLYYEKVESLGSYL